MKYEATLKNSQEESGTPKDVKGKHPEHMKYSHHEMGEYKDGEHFHDHHRGKKD